MFFGVRQIIPAARLLLTAAMLSACAGQPYKGLPAAPVAAPEIVQPTAPVYEPVEFTVFYDSDPPGAILYDYSNNKKYGETPFWAIYQLSDNDRRLGFISLDPSRVVWPSGAAATNYPGVVFALKDGLRRTYLFSRPDVKGSEDDYAYGLKRLMQRYEHGEEGNKPASDH